MIPVIILAFAISLILFGIVIVFLPNGGKNALFAIAFFFIAMVGVYVFVKSYSLILSLSGSEEKKQRETIRGLFVFAFVYLLVLLVFILILIRSMGKEETKEGMREPIVIVKVEEAVTVIQGSEDQEETMTEIMDITSVPDDIKILETPEKEEPDTSPAMLIEEEKEEIVTQTGEKEENLDIVSEIEEVIPPPPEITDVDATLVPSEPEFGEVESTPIPPSPVFTDVEAVLIPSSPVFTDVEEKLIPSMPVIVSLEKKLIPSTPMIVSVDSVIVPSAPVIESVESKLVEDEETIIPAKTHEIVGETDDPWADFYVSGSSLELLDGYYWFDLYINGNNKGEITVLVENSVIYLNYPQLKNYSSPILSQEALARIFSSDLQWVDSFMLEERGVEAEVDTLLYRSDVTYKALDMVEEIISIKGKDAKTQVRPIAGSVTLKPAAWYLGSTYSLSVSLRDMEKGNLLEKARVTFSSNNKFRIFDVYGNFSWNGGFYDQSLYLHWGSINFYKDYKHQSIRLSWGNVTTDLQSPNGTSIGIRFDKKAQYGNGERKGSSLEKTITVEKDSDVRVYNEDKEIYRETLSKGVYRLRDFVLYTGSNHIRVVITPLDGSKETEIEMDVNYSSSLLNRGEIYYGAAIAFGRKLISGDEARSSGQLDLPLISGSKLRYDFRDVSFSSYVNWGVTDTLTALMNLSIKNNPDSSCVVNPAIKLNNEFTIANRFGTGKINLNIYSVAKEGKISAPSIYFRASEQVYTEIKPLKALTFTFGYTSPTNWDSNELHTVFLSSSISGSFLSMGYSLSLSSTIVVNNREYSSWYISSALSFPLGDVSLSLTNTFSQRGSESISFTGRISASFKIGSVSTSANLSSTESSLSASTTVGKTSLWGRVTTSDFTSPSSYSFTSDFSRLGNILSLGGSFSFDGKMENVSSSLSASTSLLMAEGGLWALSSSVPSNFLLVRQKGAIRSNTLAIGEIGASSQDVPSAIIGDTLYKGLSTSSATSLSLYSYNEDSFGGAETYNIYIPEEDRYGYVLVLEGKEKYSVSGTVLDNNGIPWANGSSPLYVLENNDGEYVIKESENYLFTDRNGVFVLSDLDKGTYFFDTKEDGEWVMNVVEVGDSFRFDRVGLVVGGESYYFHALPIPYKRVRVYSFSENITADEFWTLIYGEAI